ncbi:helix-turn-helix domain-containing protein [Actinocorallia sp. API 0066]|uniref:helix-turn-helix domain-containing protein n=1 Tax=Actinocorallia sp. API 0066 TaxID=2896846 RepID=UPI001E316D81|nr:helix-turn-helix transcriptional regulator [Actinocorallia sp. API 0066]MCD0447722.1 helix-turn-helix domain-containing protein [Actinocorallia sp. API 0066]
MSSGSMTRRIQLGGQLRRLREARGITRADAGYAIRSSESKISRMELGRVGFKERDVADLLTLYGVTEADERQPILDLAAAANRPGWWQEYSDVIPAWMTTYLGLEEAASLIRTYAPQFVPDLLQTEDYARALLRTAHPKAHPDELETRVTIVKRRQHAFFRPDGPRLWAVLDEAVLRRPVGDEKIHQAQLAHLLSLKGVILQILPFKSGAHPATAGPFTLLRFPQPDLPDTVFTHSLTGSTHHDHPTAVDTHLRTMEHLCVLANPPATTPTHLTPTP